MDGPCSAIVSGGNHRGISAAAVLVGNIRAAVGVNFDVSVQAAAVGQRVNRHCGAGSKAAVQSCSEGSLKEDLAGIPVDADRWLAGAGGDSGGRNQVLIGLGNRC